MLVLLNQPYRVLPSCFPVEHASANMPTHLYPPLTDYGPCCGRPTCHRCNYLHSEGRYILVVIVELRFNALSSPSSTLLLPVFFFLLSSPSLAAHHLTPLTAHPPVPSSLVARAYHIPPLTTRPHTPSSSLARLNPLPRWLARTENPNGRTD